MTDDKVFKDSLYHIEEKSKSLTNDTIYNTI